MKKKQDELPRAKELLDQLVDPRVLKRMESRRESPLFAKHLQSALPPPPVIGMEQHTPVLREVYERASQYWIGDVMESTTPQALLRDLYRPIPEVVQPEWVRDDSLDDLLQTRFLAQTRMWLHRDPPPRIEPTPRVIDGASRARRENLRELLSTPYKKP